MRASLAAVMNGGNPTMTELCIQRRGGLAALLLLAAGAFACKPAEAPPSEAAATTPTPAAESALLAQADKAAAAITPDVVSGDAAMPPTWTFAGAGGKSAAFKRKDEFIAASGVQDPKATIKDAEVVFVGYGIQAPEYQWDDFKGQELKGKVLLMLNSDPDWDDNLFAGKRRLYYGRWTYKYESAARRGAAGAIIINPDDSAGYPFQVVQTSWTGEQFELPREDEPSMQGSDWLTHDATG